MLLVSTTGGVFAFRAALMLEFWEHIAAGGRRGGLYAAIRRAPQIVGGVVLVAIGIKALF